MKSPEFKHTATRWEKHRFNQLVDKSRHLKPGSITDKIGHTTEVRLTDDNGSLQVLQSLGRRCCTQVNITRLQPDDEPVKIAAKYEVDMGFPAAAHHGALTFEQTSDGLQVTRTMPYAPIFRALQAAPHNSEMDICTRSLYVPSSFEVY